MKKLIIIISISLILSLSALFHLKLKSDPVKEFSLNYYVNGIQFTLDGKFLLLPYKKDIVRWDLKTGNSTICFQNHSDFVDIIKQSPNQKYLITGCNDGCITIWDYEKAMRLKDLQIEPYIRDICISDDSKMLAVSTEEGHIKLWDLESFNLIKDFGIVDMMNTDLDFSPNNDKLCATGIDLNIIDVKSLNIISTLSHEGAYSSVSFESNDKLYTCMQSGRILLYNLNKKDYKTIFTPQKGRYVAVYCFSRNNDYFSSIVDDTMNSGPRIEIINLKSGEVNNINFNRKSVFSDVCFTPDSKYIATGTQDGDISVYELHDFE